MTEPIETAIRWTRTFTLFAICTTTACGTPTDPETVTPTGTVPFRVETTGLTFDPDGYSARIGSAEQPVAVDGTATFSDVSTGPRSVELTGLADNCAVDGDNPATTTVTANATTEVAFAVRCVWSGPTTLMAADRNGYLFGLDEQTGAPTEWDQVQHEVGGLVQDIGVITSMGWVFNTESWWLGLGGQAVCEGCLHTFDPQSGRSTFVSDPSSVLRAPAGFAVHPETGRAYTTDGDGSGPVYEIDPTGGSIQAVTSPIPGPSTGKGMAFAADGTLLIGGRNEIAFVDLSSGASTLVDPVELVGFPPGASVRIRSMATREDGTIFGLSRERGEPTYLVTIDPTSGAVTLLATFTDLELDGLAFIPSELLVVAR